MADDQECRGDDHGESAWKRHRAVRSLAHHARDAGELREFLAMLGLSAEEGRAPAPRPPAPGNHEATRYEAPPSVRSDLLHAAVRSWPHHTRSDHGDVLPQ